MRWMLVVMLACSSPKHEPVRDPMSVPVAPASDPTKVPVAPKETPLSHPVAPACAPPVLAKGCPATEPNVNQPCAPKGLQCSYGPSCCPPVYVCNKGVFEAHFTRCS